MTTKRIMARLLLSLILTVSTRAAVSLDQEGWEQQVDLHAMLERVGEVPWWYSEANGGANNQTRRSMLIDAVQQQQQQDQDAAAGAEDSHHRRTATTGTCAAPSTTGCQLGGQRCSATRTCCDGFACVLTNTGRKKCRPKVCGAANAACTVAGNCCSNQCVLPPPPPPVVPTCANGCTGLRCGVGTETERDNIQTFYYPWYSNIATDGEFRHWAIAGRSPNNGVYDPLNKDLPSPFYPTLGAYSSSSATTLAQHMAYMVRAGIGTLILSWWGQGSKEDQRVFQIMDAADDAGLKVGFYIEPYGGGYVKDPESNNNVGTRTPYTARDDVKYLIDKYGCHRAMYRRNGRPVMMFFAARSYDEGRQVEWKIVWDQLHNTPKYNPFVVAHDVNLEDRIIKGGWDSGHDYGTEASEETSVDWNTLAQAYKNVGKTLWFTVSPGFDDTRLSDPDKPIIDRERDEGFLYEILWRRAIAAKANDNPVVITSFNEWHEGTQIEPADPTIIGPYLYEGKRRRRFEYQDYDGAWNLNGAQASFAYLDKTKEYSDLYL
ncbi:hypothetical protein MPSEU_000261300 [Mayamaea pseudoterrestris]|nr:hypothetical protein MPSEU_000261300 [Mayamaea pseudoterrestris]